MKTKTEITIERVFLPGLPERAAEMKKEIEALVERHIDEHMVAGVPRTAIETWLWNEVAKLPGSNRNLFKALRLITNHSEN